MLRKPRTLGPFVDDAKALLHRDVLLRAVQHVGRDDEAVAVLHETGVLAELGLRVRKHRDARACQANEQGSRITLTDDRGALAGAAARRLAALDQQRLRAGLAQVVGGRSPADA